MTVHPTPEVWAAVLDDLEKLHAHPPFPAPRSRPDWTGTPAWIEETADRAHWTPSELLELRRLLGTSFPLTPAVFVHGDVYSQNILVNQQGEYVGLIDWGNARWATLEHEIACMEDMTPALTRWGERVDLRLLWRVRLNLLLMVAKEGRVPFELVREALGRLGELET